jgi:predicted NBD/HSP70 family sugar kinase
VPLARSRGTGTNQEGVRRHNLGTLLRHVHQSGGVSRAELTERMGLNRSTIGDLVRELDELAVVSQAVPDAGRNPRAGAGRPSLGVVPRPDSVVVLAAELGVDSTEVALVELGGRVLDRRRRPSPAQPTPEVVADQLRGMSQALLLDAAPEARLVGIAAAVPGVVDDTHGTVRFAPNLGWTDVELREVLASRIGTRLPVRLGNDAELGALAEHIRGVGRHQPHLGSHLIFVSCDVGVGGGIIVEGVPLRGANGYAGEVGHQRFDGGTALCRCGNTGCWETEIGSHAVAVAVGCPEDQMHRLQEFLHPQLPVTPELRDLAFSLGAGLGSLVNVFNPQVIILGGVLRWVYPLVHREVQEAMDTFALDAPARTVNIVLPSLGGDAVLIGAAELAFTDLLVDPGGTLAQSEGALLSVRGH